MNETTIVRINALFSTSKQCAGLDIEQAGDGTYKVDAYYRNEGESGFPARETTNRSGSVYQVDVDDLVSTLLAVCRQDWYHHYIVREGRPYWYPESRWSLRIEYANGFIRRWEGMNDAPKTLDGVYDLLVAFGMPRMHLGYGGIRQSFGNPSESADDTALTRLSSYEGLLEETCSLEHADEPSEDLELVAGEFFDDIRHYVECVRSEVSTSLALEAWGIEPELDALAKLDVRYAPRAKMIALFDALTMAGEPVDVVVGILKDSTLSRWCKRLAEIPAEEEKEERRLQKEQHERMQASIDEAVRKRMAEGTVFTAYDVANDVGSSTQQASVCIRRFVRKGEVQTVGSDSPRRYKAA